MAACVGSLQPEQECTRSPVMAGVELNRRSISAGLSSPSQPPCAWPWEPDNRKRTAVRWTRFIPAFSVAAFNIQSACYSSSAISPILCEGVNFRLNCKDIFDVGSVLVCNLVTTALDHHFCYKALSQLIFCNVVRCKKRTSTDMVTLERYWCTFEPHHFWLQVLSPIQLWCLQIII